MPKKPPAPEPPNGRDRLIEAAIRLFGRDGFDATSLRAVVNEADVSLGLVRFYFGSKDGLRDAAEERVVSEFLDRVSTAARLSSSQPSSQEEIFRLIEAEAGPLSEIAPFLRRAIVEERPIALDFIRRLMDAQEIWTVRAREDFPGEPWAEDEARLLVWRMGYLLLAPQFETLFGRNVYSPQELANRNRDFARMHQLMLLGFEAERKAAHKR
jgi:AcrR family transcriptional regulator